MSEDFATLWDHSNSHLAKAKGERSHGSFIYRVQNLKEKEQLYIGVPVVSNAFYTKLTGLKQSDFQIVARLVSPDNPDGQEYEFDERVDVFLGEEYYQNLRHEGLEESKKVHDKIIQSDILHLQWQEVRDFTSGEPKLKKDVIY